MKTRLSVLAILLTAGTAFAQPTAFTKPTSYEGCIKSTAFACGMRDASGREYGTAKEITHCTTYTFQTNGTWVSNWGEHGTYKLTGNKVSITYINDDGTRAKPYDLALSADGKKLGDWNRR